MDKTLTSQKPPKAAAGVFVGAAVVGLVAVLFVPFGTVAVILAALGFVIGADVVDHRGGGAARAGKVTALRAACAGLVVAFGAVVVARLFGFG